MKNLFAYITEGGASGHMKHPYDYTDYTLRDLKGLIRALFSGKVEDITEKIDGTNIQATMNTSGEVVFIRNKKDLNSAKGGMSIADMASKWASMPKVAETFVNAGKTITKVFNKVGKDFFNPDSETRIVCNCECVIEGKTNIMYYSTSQVDFHDLWTYKKEGAEWVNVEVTKNGLNVIETACEDIDNAQITPKILIKTAEKSKDILVDYIKKLDKIFKNAQCKEYDTIDTYRRHRFEQYCNEDSDLTFILDSKEGYELLYKRWFDFDKSVNIKKIKELYPGQEQALSDIDKNFSGQLYNNVTKDLDRFFIELGNAIIDLCDGFINSGSKDITIKLLQNDLETTIHDVNAKDDGTLSAKLTRQLERIQDMHVNNAEGIVFRYKGKLQKLTGAFAPLNQILGMTRFNR